MKIVPILFAVFLLGISVNGQVTVSRKTVVRNAEGAQLGLQEITELIKSKKYKLEPVPGKEDEYILKPRVGDEPIVSGPAKPNYGHGDFYDKYFGKQAPAFDLTTIKNHSLKSGDLKGKVVVLNFWFTNCKPCIEEMPALNKLADLYKANKQVVFIGVALDKPEDIKAFLKLRNFDYQLVGNAQQNGIIDNYGIIGYPTNIILDKEGKVCFASEGFTKDVSVHDLMIKRFSEIVNELLEK